MKNDVVIIGGGPGGYVAAIRSAQLGGKVVLVENDKLGGTCLNRGCIPTKSLLHSTEYINVVNEAKKYGIDMTFNGYDIKKIISNKEQIVEQLVQSINYLVIKNKIELINGFGRIKDRNTVEIETAKGVIEKKTKNIIIATGSKSSIIKVPGYDNPSVINSDGALNINKVPKSIAVVGGGAVGIELAFVYQNLGAKVTIIEMMPQLLPNMDEDAVQILERMLKEKGIEILKDAKLESITEKSGQLLNVEVLQSNVKKVLLKEQVLMATGRVPFTEGLNLESVGVKTEKGKILVNELLETNVKGIYAIGDVTGGILLAHVASAEAMVAAENCFGLSTKMDYKVIPACIYTTPEVAGVGLTEKLAIEKGYDVKVGRFNLLNSGKAVAIGATEGMVKIVADKKYGEILGVHIVGNRATDIIAEACVAMKLEATVEELISTIHAHPTISETFYEAALDVFNRSIHS